MTTLVEGAPVRVLSRRRALPGGRAVVGGFLIAVAIVAIFAAYSSSTARPHQMYVVAARDIPAGTRLGRSDLVLAALDVPSPIQRRVLFSSGAALIARGATTIAPISGGEPILSSAVVGRAAPAGMREVSIQIDRARAVAGTLKTGEYVDVLGTFGNGAEAYTVTMVPHVKVISIATTANALGDLGPSQLLTFAAPNQMTAEALADANVAAQMTLVRSPDGEPDPGFLTPQPLPYRAPGGPGGPAARSAS